MEDLITQLIETSLKRKGLPHLQPTPRSTDEKRGNSVLAHEGRWEDYSHWKIKRVFSKGVW